MTFFDLSTAVDHPYPLIRGGGLFLLCLGICFLLSWVFRRHWLPFVIAGFATGFVASGLSALLPSLGTPSIPQIAGLVGAFVLEMGLIYLVLTRFKDAEQDRLVMIIFFVVGVHFLPMGLAHGPLIAVLGLALMANAAAGLKWSSVVPVRVFGVLDAVLKIGFGAVMLFAHPALTFT
ncbi:DUF6609 family protein [Streptosporangium sp. CA-135522]|uniref:DUF6609 family protein n=1 Tax=Streptosporangium sp. CA-135522 TaxID=3240072 RepID=UPI003D937438